MSDTPLADKLYYSLPTWRKLKVALGLVFLAFLTPEILKYITLFSLELLSRSSPSLSKRILFEAAAEAISET